MNILCHSVEALFCSKHLYDGFAAVILVIWHCFEYRTWHSLTFRESQILKVYWKVSCLTFFHLQEIKKIFCLFKVLFAKLHGRAVEKLFEVAYLFFLDC